MCCNEMTANLIMHTQDQFQDSHLAMEHTVAVLLAHDVEAALVHSRPCSSFSLHLDLVYHDESDTTDTVDFGGNDAPMIETNRVRWVRLDSSRINWVYDRPSNGGDGGSSRAGTGSSLVSGFGVKSSP